MSTISYSISETYHDYEIKACMTEKFLLQKNCMWWITRRSYRTDTLAEVWTTKSKQCCWLL